MKVFEVLNLNRELLMRINEIGIRLDDCRFVDLYNDYEEMKAKGMKITYIVTMLSDIYLMRFIQQNRTSRLPQPTKRMQTVACPNCNKAVAPSRIRRTKK